MRASCYYHLTAPKNVAAILRDGLRAGEDGFIYLATEPSILLFSHIASSQIGLARVAILEVCARGLTSEVEPDRVTEIYAGGQRRVKQKVIKPNNLTVVCEMKIQKDYSATAPLLFGSNALFQRELAPVKVKLKRQLERRAAAKAAARRSEAKVRR